MSDKNWYDIKFFTLKELATMFKSAGLEKTTSDEFLSELLFTSPLALRESLARGKKMLLGKVMEQANPWDVVIHEEEQLLAVHGTSKPMPDPLFVQLKEIYVHGQSDALVVGKWLEHVQDTVKKASDKYKGREPIGILHLYNRTLFNPVDLKTFEEQLAKVMFDFPVPFKQVTVTVDSKDSGILTWQIHPLFHAIGGLGSHEIPKLKELFGFE